MSILRFQFMSIWLRARSSDDERGASLVEYALLLALIALICFVAVGVVGGETNSSFESTTDVFP